MHKINLIILTILLSANFISCDKKTEDEYLLNAKEKVEEARKLDEEGKTDEAKKLYEEAIQNYREFVNAYPQSEMTPAVYRNMGEIYQTNLKDYTNAINVYKELFEKFPDTREAKHALFMTAFIYDESLKDIDNAKAYYQKFIEKYPQDEPGEQMTESAKMMLEMLQSNRSIEDIIKDMQQSAGERDTVIEKTTPKPDNLPDTVKTR